MIELSERASSFVQMAYEHLLHRTPQPREADHWITLIVNGMTEGDVFRRIVAGPEYRLRNAVTPGHAPGHFYSPVVNPDEVQDYWAKSSAQGVESLLGIDIDMGAMTDFWDRSLEFMRSLDFSSGAGGHSRYYLSDGRYPPGDALVLGAMLNAFRPRLIYEIGSGFSSAAMLDAADRIGLTPFHLTCIDPDANRLRSLLRPADQDRVTIIERKVQDVPLATFEDIGRGDILFIDSSHVLKTGSDVHFELFEILPRLRPGVIVHFHDILFPFEYSKAWIFDKKWSWNEVYALRAFLMYNEKFKIIFFNDLFFKANPLLAAGVIPGAEPVFGGSLWLQVQ